MRTTLRFVLLALLALVLACPGSGQTPAPPASSGSTGPGSGGAPVFGAAVGGAVGGTSFSLPTPGSAGQALVSTGSTPGAYHWATTSGLNSGASVGACASRPTATGSGALYACTDFPVFYIDDPTAIAWQPFGTEPLPAITATYTTVGALSLVAQNGFLIAQNTSNGNTNGAVALTTGSLGATSVWRVNFDATYLGIPDQQYPQIGPAVCVGSLTCWAIAMFANSGAPGFHQLNFTAGGGRLAANAEVGSQIVQALSGTGRLHLAIVNDGTVTHYQVGSDGVFWAEWWSQATPSPSLDHYGFLMGNDFNSGVMWGQAIVWANTLTTPPSLTVNAASNASPVVLGTTTDPTSIVRPGDCVAVHGVTGNTGANNSASGGTGLAGCWIASAVVGGGTNTITLLGSTGTGAYVSGGTVVRMNR